MMRIFAARVRPCQILTSTLLLLFSACGSKKKPANPPPPAEYRQGGAFVKSLPYFNPDSCVVLIRGKVPQHWQGEVYQNLFLDGPEDSPLALGYRHLDVYETNFPADTAHEFAQIWRGKLYTLVGKLDSARLCLNDAYESSQRNQRVFRAFEISRMLADIYYEEGKTSDAIRTLLNVYGTVKNLPLSPKNNELKYLLTNSLAAAYHQSDNQQAALAWMRRAMLLATDEKNPLTPETRVWAHVSISTIYRSAGQLDSAIWAVQKALELHERLKSSSDYAALLKNLGLCYVYKGECARGKQYLLAAMNARENKDNLTAVTSCMVYVARAYACLGQQDSAQYFYELVLKSPYQVQTQTNEVLKQLSQIYAGQGQYKEAFFALDSFQNSTKQLYDIAKVQEVGAAKAELELELERQKSAEQAQRLQLSRQRNLIFGLTFLGILGFGLALFLRQRSLKRALEQDKWLLEQENQLLAQSKTLLQREKQLADTLTQLKTEELEKTETTLLSTKKELDATTQILALKDQIIHDLKMQNRAPQEQGDMPSATPATSTLRQMKILTEEDWVAFRKHFETHFPGFIALLKNQYPDITPSELRLFLLNKLRFDHQEIADALGISLGSVYKGRYRLKIRFGLADNVNLDEFVSNFK